MQKKEVEQAIKELELGFDFAKKKDSAVLYLINIYNQRKEYNKIISLYKILIKRHPERASYYAGLSATYAALGDEINTIYFLNKAVKLNPSLISEAKKFLKQNNININKYK